MVSIIIKIIDNKIIIATIMIIVIMLLMLLGVLRNLTKFTRKDLCQSLFLIKLQASGV